MRVVRSKLEGVSPLTWLTPQLGAAGCLLFSSSQVMIGSLVGGFPDYVAHRESCVALQLVPPRDRIDKIRSN